MRYGSKRVGFRVDLQGADAIIHPATGDVVGFKKPLSAEFAVFGEEYVPRDENGEPIAKDFDGRPYVSANIRGNFWDSEVAQRENGWTDEERERVELKVDYFCQKMPAEVWKIDDPVVALPWPTFDDQDDKTAVKFAIEAGFVMEALAYARQQEREGVVKGLEAHIREALDTEQAEQALTAV